MSPSTTAVLKRTFKGWRYIIQNELSGVLVEDFELTDRLGAILAAMAETPAEATAEEVVAWLDTHDAGWAPTGPKRPAKKRCPAVIRARHDLRNKLEGIPKGLERFVPPRSGFDMPGIEVDWEPERHPTKVKDPA